MIDSVDTLQAQAGRFLSSRRELVAWDEDSQRRCLDLVRRFQQKALAPDGLRAALTSERIGAAPPATSSTIALLSLVGVLMPTPSIFSLLGFGTSVRDFTSKLLAAALDPKVKAIAVIVDSPGGSIRLIPEAAAAMRQARGRKPVVVSVAGMAASAAYWIASNATVIEATPSASVGAIGIVTERVSLARHLEQEGIDVHVISAGKYKHEGHPALPMSEAEGKALQARVDAAKQAFVADIAAGRHVAASSVDHGYGQGRIVEAADARRLGMIDRIATVDDTIARTLAAPAVLTAQMTARSLQGRASTDRARLEQARAEIASHRARLQAARQRIELR